MENFLVVGASSGIGLALVRTMAAIDHKVYGTYFTSSLDMEDSDIEYHFLNVLDEEPDLSFLPDTLSGVAYCPGSMNLKPFSQIRPQEFKQDFELQVIGAVKVIQRVLPKLKKSGNASIVLFSTVAVQLGFDYHAQVAVAKGGLEGLTRALAAELSPGIRVNCIAPSLTDTPLAERLLGTEEKKSENGKRHPLQRVGEPSDIAEMAAFLLSPKSSWITGQVMKVDGGMSCIKNLT